jgi:hypothetical protein
MRKVYHEDRRYKTMDYQTVSIEISDDTTIIGRPPKSRQSEVPLVAGWFEYVEGIGSPYIMGTSMLGSTRNGFRRPAPAKVYNNYQNETSSGTD